MRIFLFLLFTLQFLSIAVHARKIEVVVQVPDSGWQVSINEVHTVGKDLWVIAELTRTPGAGLQVISVAKDSVNVDVPDNQVVRVFVLGKSWNWKNKEGYVFPANRIAIDQRIKAGKLVYRKKGVAAAAGLKMGAYLVGLKQSTFIKGFNVDGETPEDVAKRHVKEHGGKLSRMLNIINGYSATFPVAQVEALKKRPEVQYVEADGPIGK